MKALDIVLIAVGFLVGFFLIICFHSIKLAIKNELETQYEKGRGDAIKALVKGEGEIYDDFWWDTFKIARKNGSSNDLFVKIQKVVDENIIQWIKWSHNNVKVSENLERAMNSHLRPQVIDIARRMKKDGKLPSSMDRYILEGKELPLYDEKALSIIQDAMDSGNNLLAYETYMSLMGTLSEWGITPSVYSLITTANLALYLEKKMSKEFVRTLFEEVNESWREKNNSIQETLKEAGKASPENRNKILIKGKGKFWIIGLKKEVLDKFDEKEFPEISNFIQETKKLSNETEKFKKLWISEGIDIQ